MRVRPRQVAMGLTQKKLLKSDGGENWDKFACYVWWRTFRHCSSSYYVVVESGSFHNARVLINLTLLLA